MMQSAGGGHDMAKGMAGMSDHEARAAVLAELHARPLLPVEAPRRIYHLAFATDDDEARADRRALSALCAERGK